MCCQKRVNITPKNRLSSKLSTYRYHLPAPRTICLHIYVWFFSMPVYKQCTLDIYCVVAEVSAIYCVILFHVWLRELILWNLFENAMFCWNFSRNKWDFYMVTEYVLKHKKSVTPAPSYFVWFIRNTYAICVCAKHLLHLTSFSTYAICVLHNMKEF